MAAGLVQMPPRLPSSFCPAMPITFCYPIEIRQQHRALRHLGCRPFSAFEIVAIAYALASISIQRPSVFLDASGQVSGFDAELIRLFAEQWEVGIEFIATTPSDRINKLTSGEVDMLASAMPHTKEAEADIEFSQTYFMNGQALLVSSTSGITDLAGLNDRPVAALQDSIAVDQLRAYADANAVFLNIAPYPTYQAAIDALKSGQIAALTADIITLAQIAKNDPETSIIGDVYTQEPFGLGLAPGDSYFNNLTNFTLQNLKVQGHYDELYSKWFWQQNCTI